MTEENNTPKELLSPILNSNNNKAGILDQTRRRPHRHRRVLFSVLFSFSEELDVFHSCL